MKRAILVVIALAVLNLSSPADSYAQAAAQQRRVKGHTLTSTELPPVTIKFAKAFKYVGTQGFILYENARVEQYFFVANDDQRHIKRMFMVQFESYLPSNDYTYDYKISNTINLGGLDFMYDASVVNVPLFRKQYPNSDAGRAAAFLEAKGYNLGGEDIMFERFIRLVDETRRNELLVVYYENLSGTGLTAADLSGKGRAAGQRDKMFEELWKRAIKSFTILK
jgi:hypothetical protein